jgi:hypothetical protein
MGGFLYDFFVCFIFVIQPIRQEILYLSEPTDVKYPEKKKMEFCFWPFSEHHSKFGK